MQIGFDNNIYMDKQTNHIKERINQFDNKLYLEFGGKLFDDYHASRVLPGFKVDGKIKLLQKFKDNVEIIICINAQDIEKNKIRADMGISYDQELFRLVDSLRELKLSVNSIVITQYTNQPSADIFINKLKHRNIATYLHYPIPGYPANVDLIVSDEGYGRNEYVPTTKPLVVVTAPGPCSGKMATCLSQLYHEYKNGVRAGYAKFETFPIWNLPLKHPVNLAYEAATADLNDVNMIDPYHLDAYGVTTVNYNRDIEIFPVVRTILKKIQGVNIYNSPTDMGVNMAGYAIFDNDVVIRAANEEIIRRYYKIHCDYVQGLVSSETVDKIELIMNEAGLSKDDRIVVKYAHEKATLKGTPAVAISLSNKTVITGKVTDLMTSAASSVLNAIKKLAHLDDNLLMISPVVLEPMLSLKKTIYKQENPILNLEEVLIALSICAATNPSAEKALSKLPKLKDTEAHSTVILSHSDEMVFKKLGINLTCDPVFSSDNLFIV